MLKSKIKYICEQTLRLFIQILFDGKFFNLPGFMNLRDMIYRLTFGAGGGLHVGHKVFIDREHQQFTGSIEIGKDVFISHNTLIDYTGHLIIENGVQILGGTTILTHSHDIDYLRKTGKNLTFQSQLQIGENAYIGSNVTVLASCHRIGKNAIVAAGAVVTHDIPDYQMVGGVPAKYIKDLSVE